jgi:serine/threonine protein kinase
VDQHADHFAEFYGWYENDGSVFLSMEYFPHGDLENCIRGPVLEWEAQEIVRQLLAGLQIIHEYGITHRDLKPQNIFVVEKSPNWWVKIGDFGISKRIGGDSTYLHTFVGTALFMAPEVLDEDNVEGYTNAVDIWALGCVLYLLLAWTSPFPVKKSVRQYAEGKLEFPIQPMHDQGATSAAVAFTKMLLAAHPDDRPSAKDARQLPWMSIEAHRSEFLMNSDVQISTALSSTIQIPLLSQHASSVSTTDSIAEGLHSLKPISVSNSPQPDLINTPDTAMSGERARAEYDYEAMEDNEISLHEGIQQCFLFLFYKTI